MNESKNFNLDFSLSKEALERVKILLKDEEGSYFRISVLGGGCSGFQYEFSFDKKPKDDDMIFKEGGIDYLINNAGAAWGANYDDFPESGWDKVIDLNLKTPFFLTQKLTPLLEKKGTSEDPSRVVNIASIDGLHVPLMETYSYTASKSGIIHLTKHLAKTLVSRNIIVNAIAPGPFDSHMLGKAVNFDYSFIAESVPRKRIGSPEDIAGLCIYLCSRAGAYTIGETITCDGGLAKLL